MLLVPLRQRYSMVVSNLELFFSWSNCMWDDVSMKLYFETHFIDVGTHIWNSSVAQQCSAHCESCVKADVKASVLWTVHMMYSSQFRSCCCRPQGFSNLMQGLLMLLRGCLVLAFANAAIFKTGYVFSICATLNS